MISALDVDVFTELARQRAEALRADASPRRRRKPRRLHLSWIRRRTAVAKPVCATC